MRLCTYLQKSVLFTPRYLISQGGANLCWHGGQKKIHTMNGLVAASWTRETPHSKTHKKPVVDRTQNDPWCKELAELWTRGEGDGRSSVECSCWWAINLEPVSIIGRISRKRNIMALWYNRIYVCMYVCMYGHHTLFSLTNNEQKVPTHCHWQTGQITEA